MTTFEAAVGEWARKVEGALEAVFKECAQELVSELNTLVPVDTGFLRASLRASTTAMPELSATDAAPTSGGDILLVIKGLDEGDILYLGYTANYGAYVHYGANGRPGRPWVAMVAQRWQQIVALKTAEVRGRLGL